MGADRWSGRLSLACSGVRRWVLYSRCSWHGQMAMKLFSRRPPAFEDHDTAAWGGGGGG